MLKYLNDPKNKQFTDVLLAQRGISELLRRDRDGVVKGSHYFYKTCYNNIGNLWLACHACNITKSNKDSLKWFSGLKYFGAKFIKKVTEKGGLQQGLIGKTVHAVQKGDASFRISRKGPEVSIPTAQGLTFSPREVKPLGLVAREWFWEHHREEYEAQREFYLNGYNFIKKSLDRIRKVSEKDEDLANYFLSHLRQDIAEANQRVRAMSKYRAEKNLEGSSSSDTLSPRQEKERDERRVKKAISLCLKEKYIVKIENFIDEQGFSEEFSRNLLESRRHEKHGGSKTKSIYFALKEHSSKLTEEEFGSIFEHLTITRLERGISRAVARALAHPKHEPSVYKTETGSLSKDKRKHSKKMKEDRHTRKRAAHAFEAHSDEHERLKKRKSESDSNVSDSKTASPVVNYRRSK